jgi:hypothetical protein
MKKLALLTSLLMSTSLIAPLAMAKSVSHSHVTKSVRVAPTKRLGGKKEGKSAVKAKAAEPAASKAKSKGGKGKRTARNRKARTSQSEKKA